MRVGTLSKAHLGSLQLPTDFGSFEAAGEFAADEIRATLVRPARDAIAAREYVSAARDSSSRQT